MTTYTEDVLPPINPSSSYKYTPSPNDGALSYSYPSLPDSAPPSYPYPPPPDSAPPFKQYPPLPGNAPPFQQYGAAPIQYGQAPEIHKIRDWLIWSILNIFICCLVGGAVALVCSILCRRRKRDNDLQGARRMSTIALIVNIISTLIGIAIWIIIIVSAVRNTKTVSNAYYRY